MIRWSAQRAQIGVAAAALLVLAAVAAGTAFGSLTPADPYAQPGRLVSLPDHRKLDFRCSGHGSPTVLLEAGFGADSSAWGAVAPRIAQVTQVCAYDRAGYGFSDPGPTPRDGAAVARDLDAGLKAAKIAGPYVLVGHSAGGLYIRLLAARRIKDVVGLVFVDSSVEHQTQRLQALFGPGSGTLDGPERRPLKCLKLASAPHVSLVDPEFQDCARPGDDAHAKQIALRPETWRTQVSELDNLFTTTSDEVDRIGPLLQDIPAIVLTASSADKPAGAAVDPGAGAWPAFHHQLAAGFRKGAQRLVKSSHLMMFDRPEVVAGAALELVQAARKP
jgi:pimeloyl-ACP methyl ester carboxylesterase